MHTGEKHLKTKVETVSKPPEAGERQRTALPHRPEKEANLPTP